MTSAARLPTFVFRQLRAALRLFLLGLTATSAVAQDPTPQAVRLHGPKVLTAGARNLVHVEGLFDGKTWKEIKPDRFEVQVTGAGKVFADPAGRAMNPIDVVCGDGPGKVSVEVRSGGRTATRTWAVGTPKPVGPVEVTVEPGKPSHRFQGFGAGILFYDNQFGITAGDDLVDWCFKDVKTTFLHVLIRPGYEKENDNDDWRTLDPTKFDFGSLDRPLGLIKKALERNPGVKLYASVYSAPAWMKTNGRTSGVGSLKDGLRYRQELAEYVYAYLKHVKSQGVTIHYLGFFNEPDFPHEQEGMHFPDLKVLAETFADVAKALDTLIAADPELKAAAPVYVFPDTLGAGALTRAGKQTQVLAANSKLLSRVGVWGVHDYWNQSGTYWPVRFRELRALPGVGKKPVWMTEWSQGERHGDLASGVDYGVEILNAVRLGAEAWLAFEWCHPAGNQAGLISTDWGAMAPRERYWRSKAYHVFRQIANTTPAGGTVVASAAQSKATLDAPVETLAVRSPGGVTVHVMNPGGTPIDGRLAVRGAYDLGAAWQTTAAVDMAPIDAAKFAAKRTAAAWTGRVEVPAYGLLSVTLVSPGAKTKQP